jgi:radical SAM superfamily enzyme YgiQ (UPF0313 family)
VNPTGKPHLLLVNPVNSLAMDKMRAEWFHRYRIWKPLGLLTVAALTPPTWTVALVDENLAPLDLDALPRPDLVGLTAFSSQSNRAYEVAAACRARGIPVVMGGIHASMCPEEAGGYVDCVVKGEAESVWAQVLDDAGNGRLKAIYDGGRADLESVPVARHDLLPEGYAFGAIQTTRGCPMNCTFCSVTAFNGSRYRHRPIPHVVDELRAIQERYVLIADDNLVGSTPAHFTRAKALFRAMIDAGVGKTWITQTSIHIADDDELLELAARAGCFALFIGFESPTAEGLGEVGKQFNTRNRDLRASVKRIQEHGILVIGSFILGLDADRPGIGGTIAQAALTLDLDLLNVLFLTPLPGTRLWARMLEEGRIPTASFPESWKYYTLTFPVAPHANLSREQLVQEIETCDRTFYSVGNVARRVARAALGRRYPLLSAMANISFRGNITPNLDSYRRYHDEERARLSRATPPT